MFKINLEQNAREAFITCLSFLRKILDGDTSYNNYRGYILNLHGALELFFKKKLLDHGEYLLFRFGSEYNSLMNKYSSAFKENKFLLEYTENCSRGRTEQSLPNTVTFIDAIQRLAFWFHEPGFDTGYLEMLKELNAIRNNIMHYELDIQDDRLTMINRICIQGYIYYGDQNSSALVVDLMELDDRIDAIREAILQDKFNLKLLTALSSFYPEPVFVDNNYEQVAEYLINSKGFSEGDKEKILKSFAQFDHVGFFEYKHGAGDYWDISWENLSDVANEFLSHHS